MSDSINIDFSPLNKPTDLVGAYANAFQVGRSLAGQQIEGNALTAYGQDPNAPLDPRLMAANPELAVQLQNRQQQATDRQSTIQQATAQASGDFDAAKAAAAARGSTTDVSQLNEQQRAAAADAADKFGGAVHGLLLTQDLPTRLAMAQHIVATSPLAAGVLQHAGIDPAHLTVDSVSNGSLIQLMQGLQGLKADLANDKPQIVGKDSSLLFNPGALGGQSPAPGAAPEATDASGATPAAAPSAPVQATPLDRDALIKAVYAEAGGEPANGQAAVAHVILNRANAGYGGARSIFDVVNAPGQFEGMTSTRANIRPDSPAYQKVGQIVDSVLQGQTPDPTGGADHFLNPNLQTELGRAQPGWANGGGQRIGNHVFYGGKAGADGSYDTASTGATPPPPSTGRTELPGGYTLVRPGGASDAADTHGHVSTPAELKSAGLPATTQAWTNAKGEVGDMPKGLATQAAPNLAKGDATLTGADYLATIPANDRPIVQAYIDGRQPIPTGAALRNPDVMRLLQEAAQYDPTFDATKYGERSKLYNDVTSGKGSLAILQLNKVAGHLATLADLADKMNNGRFPVFNAVGNAFDLAKGGASVSNFTTARDNVLEEVDKLFKGGTADVAGTKRAIANLRDSSSPDQLHGAIATLAKLVNEQMQDQKLRYESGMGGKASNLETVSPAAKATLAKLAALGGGSKAPQRQAAPARSAAAPTAAHHLSDAELKAQLGL